MRKVTRIIIGRISSILDIILYKFERKTYAIEENDKTGFVSKSGNIEVILKDGIVFGMFDSLSHSLWRSQELTLFKQFKDIIKYPVADFGCGDGSFAKMIFEKKEINFGVDIDPHALEMAERTRVYENLIKCTDSHIPLSDKAVETLISNSVLEHLADLELILLEFQRVLKPKGKLFFTSPLPEFHHQIKLYFGNTVNERIKDKSYHVNILSIEEWEVVLSKSGFKVLKVIEHQPAEFTFHYYMLRLIGKNGLGMLISGLEDVFFKTFKNYYFNKVKNSINNTKKFKGANVFIIAEKI